MVRVSLAFTVLGRPAPGGSKRVIPIKRGGTFTGKTVVTDAGTRNKPWRDSVAAAAQDAMVGAGHELLRGPLNVRMTFYLQRPAGHYTKKGERLSRAAPQRPVTRPDLSKYVRAVEDACTSVIWRDDAQIVTQVAQKFYGNPERCEVEVREIAYE